MVFSNTKGGLKCSDTHIEGCDNETLVTRSSNFCDLSLICLLVNIYLSFFVTVEFTEFNEYRSTIRGSILALAQ